MSSGNFRLTCPSHTTVVINTLHCLESVYVSETYNMIHMIPQIEYFMCRKLLFYSFQTAQPLGSSSLMIPFKGP